MRIRRVLPLGAAGLALCVSSLAWGQENVNRARQAQQLMQQNNISLADAIKQAEQECNGRVVAAHVRVVQGAAAERTGEQAGAPDRATPPGAMEQGAETGSQARGQLQFIVTCISGSELRTLLVDQQGQVRPAPDNLQSGMDRGAAREMRPPGQQAGEQPLQFQEQERSGQGMQRERRDMERERSEPRGAQRQEFDRQQTDRRSYDEWDRREQPSDDRGRETRAAREREWGRTSTPPAADMGQRTTSTRLRTQRFSQLEDTDVLNREDRKLGDIEDLAIDPTTGDVKYAVLSYGGFMDMGDKLFAIPYPALHVRNDQTVVLNIPEDRIKDAPGFDKDAWPNMANPAFATEVDTYYRSAGYADGNMRTRTVARTDLTPATRIARAKEDIIGKKVIGNDDEDLGTIDDLIVDPDRTRVAYVILSAGGVLGVGATKYVVPWNALSTSAADQSYRVSMDAERLKEMRGFSGEQWPDMTDRNWALTTHRFFNVQPYWEATGTPLPPREQRIREVEFEEEEEPGEIG